MRGALNGYKPYKDGGGTVTFMLDEYEYRQFIASVPDIFSIWALARMSDEVKGSGEGS